MIPPSPLSLDGLSPWLVWLLPLASSILVPFVDRVGSRVRDGFVIVVGVITLILAASLIPEAHSAVGGPEGVEWIPVVDVKLGVLVDPLSILFANLIALIGLVVLIYSLSYMAHEEGLARYYFFMLLFIGSMIGLVMADNFLQLFIFWEMVGLCSYALVSFWYKRPEAVKAGVKVFIMTKVGDIALLAGILILYANLNTLSYSEIFQRYGEVATPILTVVGMLMLVGAFVKSAQLPLHTWLYSAMEAPTSVSCLLHGATMVKAGVYLVARTHPIFSSIPLWLNSTVWLGALTAFIGATLALHTPDIKGVPAYSTVSQIGFMMAALGVSPHPIGWFAGLFHMISHAFFQGLGFLAIGSIIHQLGTRDMRKMGGLRRDMPFTFALCIVVILARSGIPPFCSFFSKGLIASILLSSGDICLILLIYSATAVTFAYSYRFLVLTFAGEKSPYLKRIRVHEAPLLMCLSSSVLAVGSAVFGFFGNPLARFLGVNYAFRLESFFSLESLMFMTTLLIGGLPIYLIYQRRIIPPSRVRSGALSILDRLLENGYYFDSLYGGVAGGVMALSSWLRRELEIKVFERVPYLVASSVMALARFSLWNFEAALTRLIHLTAIATARHSVKIRRVHSGALPHFVLAATMGFLFLCILLLLTV
ncbi:hypothetical protein DRO55_04190 [Candidatus Bathyarchaeota archaeon]|nr:MAG: hypothetical protein DRO55_04190 [Candidatus Bathyarchaeota archaeon]